MAMPAKRKLVEYDDEGDDDDVARSACRDDLTLGALPTPVYKRLRTAALSSKLDIMSALSDELLIRIFSFMDEKALLRISSISRRFNRVTSDSQLWRPHYYRRFILPRAHRIPGFRTGSTRSSSKLRYSYGKSIWADGGWGRRGGGLSGSSQTKAAEHEDSVDWKKQYKLRHNWARGRCAVEEVPVRDVERDTTATEWQTLVKVVDGLAVTADGSSGLRAWDLKTRRLIAQASLWTGKETTQPSCLAVDDLLASVGMLDVAVGFDDGTFGIWRLGTKEAELNSLYRHATSYFGELVAITYAHPYLLTASQLGFISLFSFEHLETSPDSQPQSRPSAGVDQTVRESRTGSTDKAAAPSVALTQPNLLTSLKSHSTRPPLALSIRRTATSVVASIAYTFDAVGGWSIGIQDLDIKPSGMSKPDVVTSRVAYTLPTQTRRSAASSPSSSPSNPRSRSPIQVLQVEEDGPIRLCYSHPYLLATLPDNTLVLHLCKSTASSLSISPGIRLWGHTSGISDAEITPRGKAVSVSTRGDEIRVWELEGRVGGSSVELRPRQSINDVERHMNVQGSETSWLPTDVDDRKNWVGFDDEMVVVLKEARDGRESLMVYDFT
ncbi:hypothetical protein QQS21_008748 [Conoideocrella luteorostrata]|uniref:F-box domain-containing protein n=1 Tax=Conoideocrella luteorostrata TaxID=1105319 RepID=A0AAJ0CIA9_9HYPO|nr:hypothetical protein QQS21_008748 [Conoideocrella luteorostrata]